MLEIYIKPAWIEMRTISSLRESYTMRVLILSAFLACAAAAPSVPVILPYFPSPALFRAPIAAAIPVALPTISPGDIQAAVIDAQVKAEDAIRSVADQAGAIADQARELSGQLAENQNEGVVEANDLAKEKSELAFWTAEEQKWQALDAMKVAEAQADAAAARTSYGPYEAPAVPESSAAEQAMPEVAAKAAETTVTAPQEAAAQSPAEAPKPEEQEASVKMAEPEKPAEPEAEKPADSVQIESANLKAAAPEPPKVETQNPLFIQSFAQSPVFDARLTSGHLAYTQPFVAPVAYIQPGFKAVASPAIHPVQGHFVAPQVLHTQW